MSETDICQWQCHESIAEFYPSGSERLLQAPLHLHQARHLGRRRMCRMYTMEFREPMRELGAARGLMAARGHIVQWYHVTKESDSPYSAGSTERNGTVGPVPGF